MIFDKMCLSCAILSQTEFLIVKMSNFSPGVDDVEQELETVDKSEEENTK